MIPIRDTFLQDKFQQQTPLITPTPGVLTERRQSVDIETQAKRQVSDVLAVQAASYDAPGILAAAAKHMNDRAALYDKPGGERSMCQTVNAFNAVTGRDLKESEGWLLLQLLKDVRDRQTEVAHVDSLEDCVAYAALKAEARVAGR